MRRTHGKRIPAALALASDSGARRRLRPKAGTADSLAGEHVAVRPRLRRSAASVDLSSTAIAEAGIASGRSSRSISSTCSS